MKPRKYIVTILALVSFVIFSGCESKWIKADELGGVIRYYSPKGETPESFLIQEAVVPVNQKGFSCSAAASDYAIRMLGDECDYLELYESFNQQDIGIVFPGDLKKGLKEKGYKATVQACKNLDDFKNALSKGSPLIALVQQRTSVMAHYVCVVGYDSQYFYMQDTIPNRRNVRDNPLYNTRWTTKDFNDLWRVEKKSDVRIFLRIEK